MIADLRNNLTPWYIQYSYSATTGAGGFRLTWTRSRDDLRNSQWSSVYLNAGTFNLPGNWLDYPDIAISDQFIYIATNVYDPANTFQNSLVIRTIGSGRCP